MLGLNVLVKMVITEVSILLLQGKPIKEQVMQYSFFARNTRKKINQALKYHHKTQFCDWPWSKYKQVHGRSKIGFVKHAGGKTPVKVA